MGSKLSYFNEVNFSDFENYGVDANSYFLRAIKNLKYFEASKDPSYILYYFLEVRNCIERFLFEYKVLYNPDNDKLDKRNNYRVKELINDISEDINEFNILLKFSSIYCSAYNMPNVLGEIDPQELNKCYGRAGDFLHHFRNPINDNGEFIKKMNEAISDSLRILDKYIMKERAVMRLNEKGREFFGKYLAGEINETDLLKLININK